MSSRILALPKYRSGNPAGYPKLLQLETLLHPVLCFTIFSSLLSTKRSRKDTRVHVSKVGTVFLNHYAQVMSVNYGSDAIKLKQWNDISA